MIFISYGLHVLIHSQWYLFWSSWTDTQGYDEKQFTLMRMNNTNMFEH